MAYLVNSKDLKSQNSKDLKVQKQIPLRPVLILGWRLVVTWRFKTLLKSFCEASFGEFAPGVVDGAAVLDLK